VELCSPEAQVVQLVAPLIEAYEPALQGEHDDAELAVAEKVPAEHCVSIVAPAGQYDPDAQLTCAVGSAQTLPAAQVDCVVELVGQYDPMVQAT
jgi:hypothetical protein